MSMAVGRSNRKHAALSLAVVFAFSSCAEQGPPASTPGTMLDSGVHATGDAGQTSLDGSDATANIVPMPQDADGGAATEDAQAPSAPEAGGPARDAVVLAERWIVLGASEDPFSDRPASVVCSPTSVMAEFLSAEQVLGVDTGGCNYVTATQPTRRAIARGETIKVRLWHFELSAPEPAEAHAALVIDGIEVLSERVPIPQPGGLIVKLLRADRPIPSGARALFHLHNHGANSWALVEVTAGP